jgi:hypothetical protein
MAKFGHAERLCLSAIVGTQRAGRSLVSGMAFGDGWHRHGFSAVAGTGSLRPASAETDGAGDRAVSGPAESAVEGCALFGGAE